MGARTATRAARLLGGAAALAALAVLATACSAAEQVQDPAAVPGLSPEPTAVPGGPTAAGGPVLDIDWHGYQKDVAHSGYAPDVPAAGGRLSTAWEARLDGVVQASPLVVDGRVVAATENNTVYALDRATGKVLWQNHLGDPVPLSRLPCGNIAPTVGITGTPVYDPASRRLFAVTTTPAGGSLQHTLVAQDPADGRVLQQVPVDPPGSDPLVQNQRGALGLSPQTGRVLVTYGGHAGDCGDYHGYLVSVVAADLSGTTVLRTGTGTMAGMWQPSGPTVDAQGFAYTVSGNGSATAAPYDGSNAVNRVDPRTATSTSFFSPAGWADENARDLDLGSAGVALVGELVWAQGKTGTGYLLRAGDLGGIGGAAARVQGACEAQFGGPAVHGDVVFAPCTDGVRQITVRPDATYELGWKARPEVSGTPVVGGGRVWSVDARLGRLYSLDEATGQVEGTVDIGRTVRFASPALSGRLVLVPTVSGITAVRVG